MHRRVALLGSINVGGNRLKMAELVAALEKHDFENVETVVASGNVLFDHPEPSSEGVADLIAKVVESEFGIATFAVVRTRAELELALEENPFAGDGEDKLVHVHFLTGQPSRQQFDTLGDDLKGSGDEKVSAGTRALHINYVSGVGRSKLTGPFIERRLGCKGTGRNIRSLTRIIEKFP